MKHEQVITPAGSALTVSMTETVLERMRGLLGRPPLDRGEAMVIARCNLIHTVGMSYPIDVVFVDAKGVVLKVSENVGPRRVRGCFGARHAVETRAGEASKAGWARGSALAFVRPDGGRLCNG